MKKFNEVLETAQVAVGTTATLIVSAAPGRDTVNIQPIGVVTVYVGNAGVTVANGYPIPVGAALVLEATTDIYAVAASATAVATLSER